MKMVRNYSLKKLTTMKIGGPAKYFLIAKKEKDLAEAINRAKKNKIKWYLAGEGSNLVPNDNGFEGLIIKMELKNFERNGGKILVGSGNNLLKFIRRLNRLGLGGMEKMAGIPGTIGGAIYGCAGAYGQEIKENLIRTRIYDPEGKPSAYYGAGGLKWISKKQCRFGYRESIFKKKKNWIILAAEFRFKKAKPEKLQKTSKEIIKLREKKYRPGLLSPGSFFKNVVVKDIKPAALRRGFLSKIPKEKIMFGKVPSGYLLEKVGVKGMKRGKIRVAEHHGNLIYNPGNGKSSEIAELAKILKQKVRRKFGINLEEEIQYI